MKTSKVKNGIVQVPPADRDPTTAMIRSAFLRGQIWSAVGSMALCMAMLIASEFMPVSLLTPIAHDLRATEGAAQAISISGLFAVVTSLFIATIAGRFDRRHVLIGLTGLMLSSLILIALAPNFGVLMVARAILGIVIGGFWSLATATVMRLVPQDSVPKALGVIYTGNAVATAFAAPIGSYLGGIMEAIPVAWSTWLSKGITDEPESGGGLMVAAIQLSIMLGAAFGGLLLDHMSIAATLIGGTILLALASLIVGNGDRIGARIGLRRDSTRTCWARRSRSTRSLNTRHEGETDYELTFESKVAPVTGAGSGMGLATARAFAEAGAAVALADVDENTVRSAAEELVSARHKAIAVCCNVADETEVAAMVEQTVSTFGRLDAAYNNAGVQSPAVETADASGEEFHRVNAINLRGVWNCMKHELRQMRKQGSGAIVNCSSIGGLIGIPGRAIYHASKYGVIGLVRVRRSNMPPEESASMQSVRALSRRQWLRTCWPRNRMP
jgi:NADP-dependent 3-hydroxy acid dehydrogenase YdfG